MHIYLLLSGLALCCLVLPAQAGAPQLRPANDCFYAGAMTVVSYHPRTVAPRFYTVDPLSLSDMTKATRLSVMHPRYDEIYERTDVATKLIKYAVVTAFPCNKFLDRKDARTFIENRLKRWWRVMTSMKPYKGIACCWNPTRVHKITARPATASAVLE